MTELLSNTGFIMYNKQIARIYGVNEAILVGELCAKHQYWLEHGDLLQNDGWFYVTREDIEKDTCLSSKQQRAAFKNLQDDDIISCKLMGVPAKMFYRINTENLCNLMCQKVTAACDEKSQQCVTKGHSINRYNKKETKKETKSCSGSDARAQWEPELTDEDRKVQSLSDYYQQNGGIANTAVHDSIRFYLAQGMDVEVIREAITRGALDNKRWRYIDGILRNWHAAGCRTMVQVETERACRTGGAQKSPGRQSASPPRVKTFAEIAEEMEARHDV